VIKCDRCYGKIENDENPYCIAACPVDALKIIYTDEVDTINLDIRRTLPGLPRIQITQPLVRYVATVMGRQIFRDNSYQDGGDRE
jgi:Fe-S-cluster-containing hydrogenase components 1